MLKIEAEGMTCGHFLQAPTQAPKTLYRGSEVKVDLITKHGRANARAAAASIADSGYIVKNI
jgi:hypothetical protein